MPRVITWVKFLPAFLFFSLWVNCISGQLAVEKAIFSVPVNSPEALKGLGLAMDDPWQQNAAGLMYFSRLLAKGAPLEVWLKSEIYALALWEQAQSPGLLEVLIRISIMKRNHYDVDRLAKLYLSAYPRTPFAESMREYMRSGQLTINRIH